MSENKENLEQGTLDQFLDTKPLPYKIGWREFNRHYLEFGINSDPRGTDSGVHSEWQKGWDDAKKFATDPKFITEQYNYLIVSYRAMNEANSIQLTTEEEIEGYLNDKTSEFLIGWDNRLNSRNLLWDKDNSWEDGRSQREYDKGWSEAERYCKSGIIYVHVQPNS